MPATVAALALVAGLAAGCNNEGTVTLTLPQPGGPAAAACARLVNYLPAKLVGQPSRVVAPRSPLVHAWGSPAIVLRCGVPRPAGFSRASPRTAVVDNVIWFQVEATDVVTWTAIRDAANVQLIVPKRYEGQGAFLVAVGAAIRKTID